MTMVDNYIVASSERQAKLEAAKAAFFMRGGQISIGPGIPEHPLPSVRSEKIDPETVLVRKRRSPSPSERAAFRRIADSL